jgi:hypothetical protein
MFADLLTDQAVPDDTWFLMAATTEDNQVEPPFLAVRRYIDSKRLDYITDVRNGQLSSSLLSKGT